MIRETSVLAYQDLKDSGKLGESQQRVFETLCKYPDATANEITAIILADDGFSYTTNNIRSRFAELRNLGLVFNPPGKRTCMVNGRKCLTWAVGRDEQWLSRPHCPECGALRVISLATPHLAADGAVLREGQ